MKLKWDQWIYGLLSGVVGGGASAVVSGVSSMLMAPQQFNLQDWQGAKKLFVMMAVNFTLNAALSAFFYLKQSPLPPPVTGNTEILTKKDT